MDKENFLLRRFDTFCFICLYLMAAVMLPDISYAYFESKGEEQGFLQAGYKVNSNSSENSFALYGDINTAEKDGEQIIFPKSNFFIPVDSISIDFPLPLMFYNFNSTDNALGDLIYSNLKINKLTDEHKKIQERSQQLSWDSKYLFQQQEQTDSIYQIADRLKESSRQTIDESRLVLNYRAGVMSSKQDDIVAPSSFIAQINTDSSLAPLYHSWAPENNIVGENTILGKSYNYPSTGGSGGSSGSGSDSFIGKVFIKLSNLIQYFTVHKVEAAIYGICLTFMFLLFSAIFRR